MKKCIETWEYDCIYLTKDNVNKILPPNSDSYYIIENNDKYIKIDFGKMASYYYYNHWYVFDYKDDLFPQRFTKEEFEENFKLVEE